MNKPSVLLIPDRFMDYRLWSDIPDRLSGRAEVVHFDQHGQVPWTAANGEFLAAARRLAPDGGFHVVAAAGRAARFAFALAEAGLAKGVVFFQPSLDSLPDDLDFSGLDFSGVDLDHALDPFQPLLSAVREEDPRSRDILLQVSRDTAGPDVDPAELELFLAMMSDHAEELFADLRATDAAAADGRIPPDPPWLERPWIDRLPELTVPVTVVALRPYAEAIARRARDAEIVVARGSDSLASAEDRARFTEALLRMLDRTG
jgi:hypothetical protein